MNYLVPLDFSDNSRNAAVYAASLQKVWPGNLNLLHVIERAEEDLSFVPVKTLNVRKNTIFEMVQFQEQLRKYFDLRTDAEMLVGDFGPRVMKSAREKRSDLIVIGTQGESGLRAHLFGRRAAELVEFSTRPVLAIPKATEFKPFRHILYVTDYRTSELENIDALAKIAAKFKAVLSIVSVNVSCGEYVEEFKATVKERVPFAAINFEQRFSEEGVAQVVEEFALTQSVDLIGVSTIDHDLVRKITGQGVLDEQSFNVDLPVLFLPE